jgi:hypothetical protein
MQQLLFMQLLQVLEDTCTLLELLSLLSYFAQNIAYDYVSRFAIFIPVTFSLIHGLLI